MGAAQDHELGPGVPGQALQSAKVHLIPALPLHQGVKSDLPPGAADVVVIGIVHRGLDDHPVPRLGIQLDAAHQGHVHPGGIEDPVGPDVPAVAALLPVHAGLKIVRGGIGIAIGPVLRPAPDGLGHGGGRFKVHVRDAHGDDVVCAEHLPPQLGGPLDGDLPGAVNGPVKVVFHGDTSFPFLLLCDIMQLSVQYIALFDIII